MDYLDNLGVDEIEDMVIDGKGEESIEPHEGMEFASEQEAYDFYNTYGYIVGFSIRKQASYVSAKLGVKTALRMVCSKEGKTRKTKKQMEETIGGLIEKTPEKERSMQRNNDDLIALQNRRIEKKAPRVKKCYINSAPNRKEKDENKNLGSVPVSATKTQDQRPSTGKRKEGCGTRRNVAIIARPT